MQGRAVLAEGSSTKTVPFEGTKTVDMFVTGKMPMQVNKSPATIVYGTKKKRN